MKLSVPLTPVYYFELTPRGPRLLYYLPHQRLVELVRKLEVRKEALQDFPYGLEVEVSDEEYSLVREEYGFAAPLSPAEIWAAFRGFWVHSQHRLASMSGLIDARRLETYARQVSKALADLGAEQVPVEGSRQGQNESSTATQAERTGMWIEKRDAVLKQIRPRDANPELELVEQRWCHVRMSPGLSAELVFASAQSPGRRG